MSLVPKRDVSCSASQVVFGIGSVRFPLDDDGALIDPAADANVPNAQGHEIATAQFAINCQVEQGQLAHPPLDLEQGARMAHTSRGLSCAF
jgi:hypothetical protein